MRENGLIPKTNIVLSKCAALPDYPINVQDGAH